jgi:lipopolysaccharide export system protein LptA
MRVDHRRAGACALVLGLALGLAAPASLALRTDRDKPIEIEADRAEADDARHVTIYRGNVVIVQGTLRIEGDTVWIHYDENDELTKLVSEGRQAHFRQLPDDGDEYRMAYADRLEYYRANDLIVMLGGARYGQGADQINAQRIVYDSRLARMKADSGTRVAQPGAAPGTEAPAGGRVRIKIVPKKKPAEQ